MAINVTLTDGSGQTWDFSSDRGLTVGGGSVSGFGLVDGTDDAVDTGFVLVVNGTGVNPQTASVDAGGREINTAPVLIDGVAVSRSVLVSATGDFARFLDSFTNTTDQAITITVETLVNSGADSALQFTATTSGDTVLGANDTGYVTDDANLNGDDTALTVHYGDGTFLPTATAVNGDLITVTHTLTLQPGETQSLLQFGAQNFSASDGNFDLNILNTPFLFALNPELLAGLTDAERASVVNYSNVAPPPSATLVDSDGNRWKIDDAGRLSSLDTNALVAFDIPILRQNWDTLVSLTEDAANDEVTIVRGGFEILPDTAVTYTYRALPDQGLIRLLVTWQGGSIGIGNTPLDPTVITGANPALVPVQFFEDAFGKVSGVVLDDSESGTGGTLPALTYVFGATGADNTSAVTGSTFSTNMPGQGFAAGQTSQYLFFFALNDTGLDALADLARLNNPGPQELIGLSADVVAGFRNFDLDEDNRLQQVLGANDVDDTLTGNAWGDAMLGGTGDDDISAGGSDDDVRGGGGEDDIDGGDGNDSLFGGDQDDTITGGTGGDSLDGGLDNDHLLGQSGDDDVFGDDGNDTMIGGSGIDTLNGEDGDDALSGNRGADVLQGGSGSDTLDGGAGDDQMDGGADGDVYIVNSAGDVVTEESFNSGFDEVRASVTFATGQQSIEAVTLTGTANINATGNFLGNRLTGNDGNNQLRGNTGSDTLEGGGGVDTLVGGQDGDVYIVDTSNDTITEQANGTGIDEIRSSVNYTMGVANIELITLTGTADIFADGTNAAERLVGNTGFNSLSGFAGADTLEGGDGGDALDGGTEDDRMFGGNGIDFLFGDEGADSLDGGADGDNLNGGNGADTLVGGAGDDTMIGGFLAADIGDRMSGDEGDDEMSGGAGIDVLEGGTGDDVLFGGTEADSLFGDDGDDVLDGGTGADSLFGGAGSDTLQGGDAGDTVVNRMFGGDGSDSYIVTSANDRVTEEPADGGIDTVSASISYTLTANVENLQLLETGTNLNGTGNAAANQLTGNANDNILDGAGGDDRMAGGNGNDTYIVSDAGDVVIEANGTAGGTDIVRSSVSFTLGTSIETLLLTGTNAINGTGNGEANTITGNDLANMIDGRAGNDIMTGGGGSDLFFVSDAGDVVIETGGTAGGQDTVQSSVSFTLGDSVETLLLAGNNVINGTGNAAANTITGNIRANVLDGALGADTLTGFGGSDSFVFRTALGAANVDTIADFVQGTDRIHLDDAVFAGLATGALAARAFVNGTTALDANDRILYDIATGNLFFDADGNGAGAAVQFAIVANNAALTNASFLVI